MKKRIDTWRQSKVFVIFLKIYMNEENILSLKMEDN